MSNMIYPTRELFHLTGDKFAKEKFVKSFKTPLEMVNHLKRGGVVYIVMGSSSRNKNWNIPWRQGVYVVCTTSMFDKVYYQGRRDDDHSYVVLPKGNIVRRIKKILDSYFLSDSILNQIFFFVMPEYGRSTINEIKAVVDLRVVWQLVFLQEGELRQAEGSHE